VGVKAPLSLIKRGHAPPLRRLSTPLYRGGGG